MNPVFCLMYCRRLLYFVKFIQYSIPEYWENICSLMHLYIVTIWNVGRIAYLSSDCMLRSIACAVFVWSSESYHLWIWLKCLYLLFSVEFLISIVVVFMSYVFSTTKVTFKSTVPSSHISLTLSLFSRYIIMLTKLGIPRLGL